MLNEKVNAENAEMVVCEACGEEIKVSEPIIIGGDALCADCAEDYVECADCGERIHRDDSYTGADGETYCEDCFYDTFCHCEHCGDVIYRDDAFHVNTESGEEIWCEDCTDSDAFKCDDCGEYFDDRVTHASDDSRNICEDCYEADWMYCQECGDLIRYSDVNWINDEPYCDNCASDKRCAIHGYHSHIRPMKWHTLKTVVDRKNEMFTGCELEIDSNHEDYSSWDFDVDAKAIVGSAGYNVDEDIVCEQDGSLDYGFELISSTATIDYHINSYGWDAMMKEALNRGYTSHDAGTCGLHVHMDRLYFSDAMEDVEYNALILVTNNAEWMKKFSRREDFTYCKFPEGVEPFSPADFKPAYARTSTRDAVQELAAMRSQCIDHYHALNFRGNATIEIRFNRGTLNFETFKATLQFVQMFADAMKHSRLDTCAKIGFKWFKRVAQRRGYKEFLAYCERRGITE